MMRYLLIVQMLSMVGIVNTQADIGLQDENQDTHKTTASVVYKVDMKVVEVRRIATQKQAKVEKNIEWDDGRESKDGHLLMAPSVLVRANQAATISTGQLAAIKYLEPDGDDRFVIKEFKPEKFGLQFDIKVLEGESVKVSISSTSLKGAALGKQSFVGVEVPIGKPVLIQKETQAMIGLHELPAKIAIPAADGKYAYLMVRVLPQ